MVKTIEAVYDGSVLRPIEPLEIAPNTRVTITIEATAPAGETPPSFLRTARALSLEGPPDWSSKVDDYLSGSKPWPDE